MQTGVGPPYIALFRLESRPLKKVPVPKLRGRGARRETFVQDDRVQYRRGARRLENPSIRQGGSSLAGSPAMRACGAAHVARPVASQSRVT